LLLVWSRTSLSTEYPKIKTDLVRMIQLEIQGVSRISQRATECVCVCEREREREREREERTAAGDTPETCHG